MKTYFRFDPKYLSVVAFVAYRSWLAGLGAIAFLQGNKFGNDIILPLAIVFILVLAWVAYETQRLAGMVFRIMTDARQTLTRALAFERYQSRQRICSSGDELTDWLQAEQEARNLLTW